MYMVPVRCDGEHRVPVLGLEGLDLAGLAVLLDQELVANDAGVVDEGIDATGLLVGPVHEVLHPGFVGDIELPLEDALGEGRQGLSSTSPATTWAPASWSCVAK